MFKRNPENARMGVEILPFETYDLPEFFRKKSEYELNDTPENRKKGINEIRQLLKDDNTFEGIEFEDDFLLIYLRTRKYNAARVFTQLKALVNLSKTHPSMFSNIKFENLCITTQNKITTFLPWRCQDGCAILVVHLDKWDPTTFPVVEVKKMVLVYFLQSQRYPMTQINGFKLIFDFRGNPIREIRHYTPSNMYLLYHGPMECSPARIQSIHIIGESLLFSAIYYLIKPFLSSKIKQRILIHRKPEELLEHFPRAVLPVQYGGDLVDYDMSNWLEDVTRPEKLRGCSIFANSTDS